MEDEDDDSDEEYDEDSEEESGLSWDELEARAKKVRKVMHVAVASFLQAA
jgi:hypothetical protein